MAETPAAKHFNWLLVFIPVGVLTALLLAFVLPPSHALIVNGPLKPLFARFAPASRAGTVAAHGPTPDPALEVKRLSDILQSDKKAAAEKDTRIAQLQSQLEQRQAAPKVTPVPLAKGSPAPVSDDVKRVGAYWAAMDADKAADVARQLPNAYVQRVFAAMPADAVAEIMNVLPAKTAAALTASPEPARR